MRKIHEILRLRFEVSLSPRQTGLTHAIADVTSADSSIAE